MASKAEFASASLMFRLRSGGLFLLSIFLFIVSEAITVRFASVCRAFLPLPWRDLQVSFELFYRPVHLILLVGIFAGLLRLSGISEPLTGQGLNFRIPYWRQIGTGSLLSCGLVSIAVLAIKIFGNFTIHLHSGSAGSISVRVFAILFVLASAAMLEEVMFRGYPFQRLIEAIGPFLATAFLSLLFGVIHLRNPGAALLGAVNTVLVGVFFSIAYLRTKALWLPFGIHFAWNTTMGLIFGLPVSGLTMFSVLVEGSATGPEWLTGGAYGIEASLTGTVIILLGTGLLTLLPGKKAVLPIQAQVASN